MGSTPVSPETRLRISVLFRDEEVALVEQFLQEECGTNLPFLENLSSAELDRFRFAALKLSEGNLAKLDAAIKLAKQDWRDLLVAADFAEDVEAHWNWFPGAR